MPIIQVHSSEYEDHRMFYINTRWIKMFYQHPTGVSHIILGDGYSSDDYPVECIPVQESAGDIAKMFDMAEVV